MTDEGSRIGRADLPEQELPDDLEILVRTAVGWMHRRMRTSGATGGLGYAGVSLINRLRVAGPQSIRDLADWEAVSEPAIGQSVARLIEGGYIERDGTGRSSRIRATARGVSAAERWIDESLDWLRSSTGRLAEGERTCLRRASEILIGIARS